MQLVGFPRFCLLATLAALLALPVVSRAELYVTTDSEIDEISANGTVSTFSVLPNNPHAEATGLVYDGNGTFYAADNFGGSIDKVASDGSASDYTGSRLYEPIGLAMDRQGNFYTSSPGTGQINKISADGRTVSLFASLPANSYPNGLAFDASGNLYVANGSGTISKITPGGMVSTFANLGTGGGGSGLVFDTSGNLYVAGYDNGEITKINDLGAMIHFASLGATASPVGLAFDGSGNLFVVDDDYVNGNNIVEISPDGQTVTTYASNLPGIPEFIAVGPSFAAPAPEPSTWVILAGAGVLCSAACRRRSRAFFHGAPAPGGVSGNATRS